MTRRFVLLLSAAFAAFGLGASPARAEKPEIFAVGGVAIRGYDPVAYFTLGRPTKGSPSLAYAWKGASWHFATAEHRDLFKAAPEKYAPQYGGYCAYGVSYGAAPEIDPEAWRIVNGKLYLNYSKAVQARWEQDIPGFIKKADANWPSVLKK
jgi:YHS domain-containing protein